MVWQYFFGRKHETTSFNHIDAPSALQKQAQPKVSQQPQAEIFKAPAVGHMILIQSMKIYIYICIMHIISIMIMNTQVT